jgi:hypothetical protein
MIADLGLLGCRLTSEQEFQTDFLEDKEESDQVTRLAPKLLATLACCRPTGVLTRLL